MTFFLYYFFVKVPYNYIALILFTIFFSFFVAAICAWYNPKIVLVAAILTLVKYFYH